MTKPTVELQRASKITPMPINWLWPGWLAKGKLHILAGAPGTGKTTLAINLAATITSGGTFPDGTTIQTPGRVIMWSGEDDYDDSVVPRFLANGGNPDKLILVRRTWEDAATPRAFDPATDMRALLAEADGKPVDMLIIDPIISAVAGDSHKSTEVRRSLQPIVDFAGPSGTAVLGITHYSKGTAGRDPVERVTGSLTFGAFPRMVFGTSKPTRDGMKRRIVRAKSNIGPAGDGFEFDVVNAQVPGHGHIESQCVSWGTPIYGSPEDLLAEPPSQDKAEWLQAPDREWLVEALQAGPVEAAKVLQLASDNAVSRATLYRAKTELNLQSNKVGASWFWSLPKTGLGDQGDQHDQGDHRDNMSTLVPRNGKYPWDD